MLSPPERPGESGNIAWVCVHTDASRTLLGKCGDDEPSAIIPSSFSERRKCIQDGRIRDWDVLRAAWTKGFEYLQVGPHRPFAVVVSVPIFSQQTDVESLATMLLCEFKADAVFLSSPWTAAMMASGTVSRMMVYLDDTAACVVPVMSMTVVLQAVYRLPFGARHLSQPAFRTALFQAVHDSFLKCSPADRAALSTHIVISSTSPESIDMDLILDLQVRSRGSQALAGLSFAVDPLPSDSRTSVWVGLSVIGSLSTEVHEKPVIEGGIIGAYITREQFRHSGTAALFAKGHALTLASVSSGEGTTVQVSEARPPSPLLWDTLDQWVCVHTDANHTFLGRCGEDEPVVSIPTSLEPLPCFDNGTIKDWENVFTTWWKGLEHLEVSLLNPHAVAATVPPMSTRSDVERIVDIFFRRFHVPALFLANPWMMSLMANGSLTGVVVHVSDTAATVAPIVNVRVVDEAVRSVPIGATEMLTESGRDFIFQAIVSAVEACPRSSWPDLLDRIIPSGLCGEEFISALPLRVSQLFLENNGQSVRVNVDTTAEPRLAAWTGLSIIGALTVTMHCNPTFENESIGAYMTMEDFMQHGPSCAFMASSRLYVEGDSPSTLDLSASFLQEGEDDSKMEALLPITMDASMECHQGWLEKKGGGRKSLVSRSNWKRRWFVLQGIQLTYHKNSQMIMSHSPTTVREQALGVINLLQASDISEWDGKPLGITITTEGRTYYITAGSEDDRRKWLLKLTTARGAGLLMINTAERNAQIAATGPQLQLSSIHLGTDTPFAFGDAQLFANHGGSLMTTPMNPIQEKTIQSQWRHGVGLSADDDTPQSAPESQAPLVRNIGRTTSLRTTSTQSSQSSHGRPGALRRSLHGNGSNAASISVQPPLRRPRSFAYPPGTQLASPPQTDTPTFASQKDPSAQQPRHNSRPTQGLAVPSGAHMQGSSSTSLSPQLSARTHGSYAAMHPLALQASQILAETLPSLSRPSPSAPANTSTGSPAAQVISARRTTPTSVGYSPGHGPRPSIPRVLELDGLSPASARTSVV